MEKKEVAAQQCVAIPITKIKQIVNSRSYHGDNQLPELMRSMRETGLLQPIGLKAEGKEYEVVWGNRRFEAARKLGWKTIASFVVDDETTEQQVRILNAVENMQRQDVAPAEQGRIFDELVKGGLKPTEIAARIGVPTWKVAQVLGVFRDVPKKYRDVVINRTGPKQAGMVPLHTAQAILRATAKTKMPKGTKEAFFEYATNNVLHDVQTRVAAALIRQGTPVAEALKTLDGVRNVHISFAVKAAVAARLEKKTGKGIQELAVLELAKHKQFGVLKSSAIKRGRRGRPQIKAAVEGGGEE